MKTNHPLFAKLTRLFAVVIFSVTFISADAAAKDAEPIAPRLLSAMLRLSPPNKHHAPPGWEETPEAALARYQAIAEDIASVARNRIEAGALLGIAWHESGFYRDVDIGPCAALGAYRGRCDGGKAVSLWQLQVGDSDTRKLVRTNRREAARLALRLILHSRKRCAQNEPTERLAGYAGGSCNGPFARKAARSLDGAVRRTLALL